MDDASKKLQQGKDALCQLLEDRLLHEYRAEKETLLREMAFLTKIAELENYRARLKDGAPCPLCGATEHPFAEGNIPIPDETEQKIEALTKRISTAEDQQSTIRKLEEAEFAARINLTTTEQYEIAAASDKKVTEKALGEVKESLEKLRADVTERRQTVSARLHPLGITEIPDTDISSLIKILRTQLKVWQAQIKKKE